MCCPGFFFLFWQFQTGSEGSPVTPVAPGGGPGASSPRPFTHTLCPHRSRVCSTTRTVSFRVQLLSWLFHYFSAPPRAPVPSSAWQFFPWLTFTLWTRQLIPNSRGVSSRARGELLQGTGGGLRATAHWLSTRDPASSFFPGVGTRGLCPTCSQEQVPPNPASDEGPEGAAHFPAGSLTHSLLPLSPQDTYIPLLAAFLTRGTTPDTAHTGLGGEREGRLPGPSPLELLTLAAWSPQAQTLRRGPAGEDAGWASCPHTAHHPQLPLRPRATSKASGPNVFFLLSRLGFFLLQTT